MNTAFERITSLVVDTTSKSKYLRVVEPFAERHGSWELIVHSEGKKPYGESYEELNRYLTIALTELGSWYELEFWAGADNNRRFTRQLVSSVRIDEKQIEDPAFIKDVTPHLTMAIERTEAFQYGDLTEVYPPTRPAR